MLVVCPSCKSDKIIRIGDISPTDKFAGRVLDRPLPGGVLYKCNSCYLYFRWPRLSKGQLDFMYQQAAENNWQYHPEDRRDWQIAAEFLNAHSGYRTILDIGCWDGSFLRYLGTNWQRYGVEINDSAARRAEEHGIQILARNIDEIEQLPGQFGAVTAFDFVEHVDNPRYLLTQMSRLVSPGGFLIISTGDTDAPSRKLMGSKYYYCTISEHISFINRKWCYNTAKALNLHVERIERFSHEKARNRNVLQMSLELTKNVIYRLSPNAIGKLRAIGFGRIDVRKHEALKFHPPSWTSAKDHLIAIFRKL